MKINSSVVDNIPYKALVKNLQKFKLIIKSLRVNYQVKSVVILAKWPFRINKI